MSGKVTVFPWSCPFCDEVIMRTSPQAVEDSGLRHLKKDHAKALQIVAARDSEITSLRAGLEEAQAKITAAVNVLSAPPAYGWNAYATKIRDALAILEGEK